jgi:hypothetical protein
MRINYITLSLIIVIIISGGCKKRAAPPGSPGLVNPIEKEHAQAVEDGYKSVEFAASIRSKFQAISSIQNFKHISLPQTWQTMFYVYGRYEMVLQVPITYDTASGDVIPLIEESELHIFNISSVSVDSEVYHVSYQGSQRKLSFSEIKNLAETGWNFEEIGIFPEQAKIPNLEDYIQSWGEMYPDQKRWLRPCAKVR